MHEKSAGLRARGEIKLRWEVEEDVVIRRVRVGGKENIPLRFFQKGDTGHIQRSLTVTLSLPGGAYPTTKENQHNTGNTVGAVLSSGVTFWSPKKATR
jgi:hypothetical protein